MFLGIATCCMCQPLWLDVPSRKTGWFYRLKCHTGQRMEAAKKEFALSQWFLTESAECQQAIAYRETTQSAFMGATPSGTTVFPGLKFRQPKQNLSLRTPLATPACWADVSVGQASEKFKPRNSSTCAKFFKPRDKGSVEQNFRKGPTVYLLALFQLLGVLRVGELSRTDMKANDTALNLLVCPSVPVRLSKHLLGFLETPETTNQHDGWSGPLPSQPGPLSPQSPRDVRPVVGI